jgi:alpha-1,2-mannosyltransferase
MALLFTVLATVAALFLGLYVLSTAGIYFLLFVLQSLGWYIKSKTQGRREVILNRVRIENEEYERKRRRSPSGASGEDEEWEKVDATTCIGIAQNGEPLGDEWEGIIGFFHPFW